MLRRAYGKADNKGASLVLVIISMLFVGVIAAAILRMTVGNNKTVESVSKSSETFYGTESALDDLKLYLQKFANDAATKAYAQQLGQIGIVGNLDKAKFDYDFKVYLKQALEGSEWTKLMSGDATHDNVNIISRGEKSGSDGIVIQIGDFAIHYTSGLTDTGADIPGAQAAITGIRVTTNDNGATIDGYQSSIYTDIVFSANMPKIGWTNPEKNFEYDADKYVIIGDGNVNFNNFYGNVVGSVYAKNNINISAESSLTLKSKYIIAGNDINVLKGTLSFAGFDKALLDLKKDTTSFENKSQENENIWCNNFSIERGTVSVGNAKLYVKDDLSLNGDNTEFAVRTDASTGKIVGFSSENGNTGDISGYDRASAIIVNGAGAKVDLTHIGSIVLAGTAYTEIPKVPGQATNIDYFVQGESITYRTIQSMYMVDAGKLYYTDVNGDKVYIGRNPMTLADYDLWKTTHSVDMPTGMADLIVSTSPFRVKAVQYPVNGHTQEFYYIYWNFESVQDAVKYFYDLNDTATIEQKVKMLGSGYIKLPADNKIDTSGNVVKYNPSETNYFISKKNQVQGLSAAGLQESIDARTSYLNLKSTLAKDKLAGTDLFDDALFVSGELNLADISKIYTLKSPAEEWTDVDEEGNTVKFAGNCLKTTGETAIADPTDWTYKLVTGENIKITGSNSEGGNTTCLRPEAGVKYVVITKGNVTMDAGCNFNGIIFAKGDVTVYGHSTFNCFGNFYRTVKREGETQTSQYITEFEALLDVKDGDENSPNSILRRIFGLSTSSANTSGTDVGNDMGKLTLDKYKKE